jgi:general secretion pathway protein G
MQIRAYRTHNRTPNRAHHRASSCAGFTLLELLVVVMILGVLVGLVGPRYFSHVGKSEVQVARAQIDSIEKALEAYRLDMGGLPSTSEGLEALVTKPTSSNAKKWRGPYLRKAIPPDPWGNAYIYRTPGTKFEFEIISLGKDGKSGGDGDNADLSSDNL